MKHNLSLVSIAMATLVVVSLCAVCASSNVTAADSGSNTNTRASRSVVNSGIIGDPAVCMQPDASRWAMFVKGADGAIWWSSQEAGKAWSAWTSLGGGMEISSPAAVSKATGDLEVYVRGGDGVLYLKYSTDWGAHWLGWVSIPGGQILDGTHPSVSFRPGTSTVDVFVTGTNHHLYYRTWTSSTSWSGWKGRPQNDGYVDTSPAAVSKATGDLEVYIRGSNGALYITYSQDGGASWTNWAKIGGGILAGTSPAVSYQRGTTTVDVSVAGTNRNLYLNTWTSSTSWSGWKGCTPLGILTASPSQLSRQSNSVQFYVSGVGGVIYYTYWWYGWANWWSPQAGP